LKFLLYRLFVNHNGITQRPIHICTPAVLLLPQLFTKFGTKAPSHGVQKGTGLGLFISKNIIEAHGGKIWAENNTKGNGATFTFSVPLGEKVP